MPRVSISSASGICCQSSRGAPISTSIRAPSARRATVGPPRVPITALSCPEASSSSQPTQRRALPQVSTLPPSAFHTRMKAVSPGLDGGSMTINWSQPGPVAGSDRRRTVSSSRSNPGASARRTMKAFPAPFIFRYGIPRALMPCL